MNKFGKFSFVLIVLGIIGGCSSAEKGGVGDKIEVDELIFAQNPEPVRGKLDVYASMARGVKYNVDVAAQEMNKKLFSQNQNMAPQDIIQNMMNVKSGRDNPLYDSLRALDYAVIYAMVNLSGSRSYIDSNIFVKTSQNLALASIKAHKGALFAARQLKEIARLTDKQQKKLNDINKKEERTGRLTPAELSYKKGLEVALLKLKEMYEAQAFAVAEYAHLVKAEPKELKLEGRTFYELDDLDKKLTVRAFQRSAFNNRSEFDIAKEMGRSYRFREVEYNLLKKYPEIERLNINGYDVEDEVYAENLEKRAYALALGLATKEEIETIKQLAFKVNEVLKAYFLSLNVRLVDFKLEFGRLPDGTIVLADEISPDTCRFWDATTNEKLDKDRFRRDMGGVEDAYREMMKRVFG